MFLLTVPFDMLNVRVSAKVWTFRDWNAMQNKSYFYYQALVVSYVH